MKFLFAGASLISFSFLSETKRELLISYLLYLLVNCSIGYFLDPSGKKFWEVTCVFLIASQIFASFFFLKARRIKKSFADTLLSNNREGIHILLVVYLLVLGVLLTQLTTDSVARYLNWLMGLGIQIGFLTVLNYYLKK